MSVRVAGSLWSVPTAELGVEADRLAAAGLSVWHWDRADGSLGPSGGFSPETARELTRRTGLTAEAHLMLADPLPEIEEWATFCDVIVVHAESPVWREAHDRIRERGVRPGLAISPDDEVPPELEADVAVLVMTVSPGKAGSGFLEHRLPVLSTLEAHPLRGVDGSVDGERGMRARRHGANWLVSGTALTSATDPGQWLGTLRT
ncbi:beta/alpha barrel domain-containing protein [Microbacterium aquimaris]|uniref:Ribulose-phosphate 3-epimerase n=1 Tax=Microbacterium aquimaris TaxID=459816 RepID=A0ABU5N5C1_9MICO|nr:hypothetical protein [Microbacterium aquimaris]MDZ8161281.1 hypothetical protein [Microbacterium aquimaris]